MYCLHHDEEALLGSDPVPCPLCGFGADQDPASAKDEIEVANMGDSNDALRHALFSAGSTGSTETGEADALRGYW